jgi:hypothetical protein
MKKYLIVMAGLLSLPLFDYAAASFQTSLADTAEAYGARRTAFVARGPGGGVVVGARRTAWGGRGYYYLESSAAREDSYRTESDGTEPELQNSEDSREPRDSLEENQ